LTAGVLALSACQTTPEQPTDDLLDVAIPAAISVRADGCNPSDDIGSGSMIDAELAVTAAHVVAGATAVRVVDSEGALYHADVVMFDPALDLAVLRAERPIGASLSVGAPAESDDAGVIVTFRGTEERRRPVVSRVRVARTVNIDTTDIYLRGDVTRPGFEVTADIEPGDSGGVVVLPGGIAAGMIWAKSTQRDDRAWAIDLPAELGDADVRAGLLDPVDTGACTR
jgi:S1-C subfamily serine protease